MRSIASKPILSLFAAIALALSSVAPALAAASPIVLADGTCNSPLAVQGPWDIYQDVFFAQAPTWLPAHTHAGIECTLGLRGTTTWWFAGMGNVPIMRGHALLTPQGRVHTAGDAGPGPLTYFAVHVLIAGSPFRSNVIDASAPAQIDTKDGALFSNKFAGQAALAGAFSVRLRELRFAPNAALTIAPSAHNSYFSVVSGSVTVVAGDAVAHYGPSGHFIISAGSGATVQPAAGSAVVVENTVTASPRR